MPAEDLKKHLTDLKKRGNISQAQIQEEAVARKRYQIFKAYENEYFVIDIIERAVVKIFATRGEAKEYIAKLN